MTKTTLTTLLLLGALQAHAGSPTSADVQYCQVQREQAAADVSLYLQVIPKCLSTKDRTSRPCTFATLIVGRTQQDNPDVFKEAARCVMAGVFVPTTQEKRDMNRVAGLMSKLSNLIIE